MRQNRPTGGSRFSVGIGHRQSSGQKQTTVVSPELKGGWRNGAPNTPKIPNKLQSFEAALSFLGQEYSGARAELEAALTRARGH